MLKKSFPNPNYQPPKYEEKKEELAASFAKPEQYLEILKERGLENQVNAYEKMLEIAAAIDESGGRALLVGGCVRDWLFGKVAKDFDLEVYGLKPDAIEEIVSRYGNVSAVGKAFGILKVSFGEGIDLDVSLPRTDSKIGEGHRGFEVKADPKMSIEDAARRRDFTMNALCADPLSGEIFDYFGGVEDIKHRRLRVTDTELFRDDPLRVMRAIQFIGRFGLSLDSQSAEIIQEMAPQLKELPKERIFEEWKKLLLKSEVPSMGLSAGMALGIFESIHPEFPPLAETPQDPFWHPEGDVWMHTLKCMDAAKEVIDVQKINEENALAIMIATLCHDLGKISTTVFSEEKGRLISHGHEPAGEEPTNKFLDELGADNLTRDKVVKLVVNHLAPSTLYINKYEKQEKITDGAIRRLAKRIHPATIQELVAVALADHIGRGPFYDDQGQMYMTLYSAGEYLVEEARKLGVEKSKPVDVIMGRDLIGLGYQPGPAFGKIIDLANQLRDDKNFTKEQIMEIIEQISPDDRKNQAELISKFESML